ncbi:major facilitator family transporter [Brucella abortus bv. 4 str. 292]|uniref:Transmembrane permease transporter n=2 Tax=Brucella pinnipedialis TaxID=120576 RepID=A0ABM9ZQ53_BRUPB|nr:general substrate transporter [Brucella abortus NCTC 8038]EEX56850.1 major facilitator family transporter [Brucella abortus bv. 4 str. 292]EEX60078.1 transmembrane permease transporter [Brucella abortus bv. 2 str. 86/8/59]EEX63965.1 transmembrane permease transporter [Brucella abortus bv. 6 str. 870]EEX79444.1 major facilitator family transporter [Brucella abortus bv. 9 str. C68]EEX84117.1 major facilitator family transporter [Brucella abortus bv. 3 str. Tulya]EEX85246.1 transmembrane perm
MKAMKNSNTAITSPEVVENMTYRKVAFRIIPLLMICYIIAYLDRVNVGFAKLQMSEELGFSEAIYGLGAGLFFIGYFFFEIPSNILLHKLGARLWIARIMITWGLLSALFAFVQTEWQFYILRFLLGAAEAGFYPGVILYLTYWFPSHRRGKMFALFQAGSPAAGIFGNPLSGWIMDQFHDTAGWQGWQWMFVLEAIPAVVLGVVILLYLDNSVKAAKWLTEEEKAIISRDIEADSKGKAASHSLMSLVKNPMLWVMTLIYFCFVMGQYGLTLWMPTLIRASGVTSNVTIGLLGAIPFICAIIAMVIFSRSADHYRERRWHLVVPALLGAVGFVVAASATNTTVSIIFLSMAAAGVLACAPLFWSLPTAILSGAAAAAGIALINSVANLAGFISPYMVGIIRDATHSSELGMYVLAGFLILGAAIVLCIPASKVNR